MAKGSLKNNGGGIRQKLDAEHRRQQRESTEDHGIGLVRRVRTPEETPGGEDEGHLFVEIRDRSARGASFACTRNLAVGTVVDLLLRDAAADTWSSRRGTVRRQEEEHETTARRVDLQYLDEDPAPAWPVAPGSNQAHVGDLDFLTATPFFAPISGQSLCTLLNRLRWRRLLPDERLITQGQPGDGLFLVQEGECSVRVEKEGELLQVAKIHPGEVVGEMAVFTGEPRTAHVDALTPVKVWELTGEDFERLAGQCPDIRIFLTELIANRFENSPHTADRKIGKFIIKQPLGKGGWSIVYRGVHSRLEFPVAIKMMRHDMAMEEEFLSTFRTEAELIAPMSHPNIVQVYDIEELYRTVFIVMEYMEGLSLDHVLEHRGMLPASRVLNILVQVLSGLKYAHARGIVHRDIKPANIFVLPEDRIKILDFGLACAPGTEDMSLAGTVKYAPPEQIDGDPVDCRADIYSTGIMAYEMIAGQRPYPEEDTMALMDLHCEQDIPDPALLVPDIPEGLQRFILKACRRDPEQRYQNADQALDELEELVRKMGLDVERAILDQRHMTSLFVFYSQAQKQQLTALLEEFSAKANSLGMVTKTAEFKGF